ncbi:MAG: tyrosine-protein phosphatase [Chloroflexi bacterium]|nr:tyrosine-protein phosphatase [Chloroflexota bacterium]
MTSNRILNWEGCNNVRDLGGMNVSDGGKTRWGAIVRGDTPSRLTANGWSALYAHGIRTIISLRTHGMTEDHPVIAPPQSDVRVVSVEIEDVTDREFATKWASSDLWGTPLYFSDALARWPQRHANALKEIARAQAGGILFHCIRGHDRTGIIALLALALTGVALNEIVADYELSADPVRDQLLAERNTTAYEVIHSTITSLDLEDYLLGGGMTQDDIRAVRTRFVEIR